MKKRLLIITFLIGSISFHTVAQTLMGRWDFVESADGSTYIPREEGAMGVVEDKLIVLGGRGEVATSIYDLNTKTWTSGTKPPVSLHHFQAVAYEGKIYVAGAFTGNYPDETPVSHIYAYDPVSDKWEQLAEIPEHRRRGAAGAVIYKEKLYIVCGIRNGHQTGHVPWLDAYDFQSGEWTELADAPRTRDHHQVAVAGNKLYAVGGRKSMAPDNTFAATIAEVDVYDWDKARWQEDPLVLPTLRAGLSVVALGRYVMAIGGESAAQKPAHIEVEAYDTRKKRWAKMVSLIDGRHGMGAVVHKNKVYTAGGNAERGGGQPVESMEFFTLKN